MKTIGTTIRATLLFFLAALLLLPNAKAQSVGVVLSGGGSKGLAHIGVLRDRKSVV